MMKNFWTYKFIKPTVSHDKIKRYKISKLINKAFGGKDDKNKMTKKRY